MGLPLKKLFLEGFEFCFVFVVLFFVIDSVSQHNSVANGASTLQSVDLDLFPL